MFVEVVQITEGYEHQEAVIIGAILESGYHRVYIIVTVKLYTRLCQIQVVYYNYKSLFAPRKAHTIVPLLFFLAPTTLCILVPKVL